MKRLFNILLSLVMVAWVAGAQSSQTNQSDSHKGSISPDDVKKYIQDQGDVISQAMKNKDIDKLTSLYWHSPNLVVLDPTENINGYDDLRNSWATRFDKFDFTNYAIDKTNIDVQGDVAVESGVFTVTRVPRSQASNEVTRRGGTDQTAKQGTTGQGTINDLRGRYLRVWELKDGKWVITASHTSFPIPFQMQSQLQDRSGEVK